MQDSLNTEQAKLVGLSEEYKNNRKMINELPSVRAEMKKFDSILLKYKEKCGNIYSVIV